MAPADRLDPVVPGPHPGPAVEDAAGWNRIDKWGVWQCTLCAFPVMQNIPGCYREIWAAAMGVIFRMIQETEGGIELERGLKWLLILPKVVFRQGRRAGNAGKGMVAQRINCLVREAITKKNGLTIEFFRKGSDPPPLFLEVMESVGHI